MAQDVNSSTESEPHPSDFGQVAGAKSTATIVIPPRLGAPFTCLGVHIFGHQWPRRTRAARVGRTPGCCPQHRVHGGISDRTQVSGQMRMSGPHRRCSTNFPPDLAQLAKRSSWKRLIVNRRVGAAYPRQMSSAPNNRAACLRHKARRTSSDRRSVSTTAAARRAGSGAGPHMASQSEMRSMASVPCLATRKRSSSRTVAHGAVG